MKEELLVLMLVIFATLITLFYVFFLFHKVSRVKITNEKADEIHKYIHKGAMTFLVRERRMRLRSPRKAARFP